MAHPQSQRADSSRLIAAILLAASIFTASALPVPNVIVYDPIREVWVDASTRGVVTVTSNSVTNPAAGSKLATPVAGIAAGPGDVFVQQGETRPQRWSDKSLFPLVLPDKEWFKTCGKKPDDSLSMATTKCDLFKDIVNCQQLAQMGYLPQGVQSFVPGGNMNGGFTLPNGCSSGNLGIEYDGLKMVFNSPQIPILAVIAKDIPSKVYYFGSGVTQGRLWNLLMLKAEFCYAPPGISPLYVSKTASYSTGMQPGTAAWNFFKTVSLAPPFSNNVASMFRGDSADATWTLSVQKTGTDTSYQGSVQGQITITNPQNVPVNIYAINDYVQGGPKSTVSCGAPVPFQVQPCSSTVCNYVSYWPSAPLAGTYTNLADVQYSVGSDTTMGNAAGTSIFQVGQISAAVGSVNTAAGTIPAGQAVVQDGMAPQAYFFSGTTQQSYTTKLSCPDSAIMTNEAMLTASTGQQLKQTATVQKLCYDLQVRVAQAAAPYVGRWNWNVTKSVSARVLGLKPSQTSWDRFAKQQADLAIASGQDPMSAMASVTGGQNYSALSSSGMPGTTNAEVTYTVTFERRPPTGIASGAPAFQAMGDVFITNPSPLNAQLREVTVSISNSFGGLPYTTTATCPLLTVAAGQTLQCRFIASPSFNPVGAQVTAAAVYMNTLNGMPTGSTTPFTSAPVIVGGGSAAAAPAAASGRRLAAAQNGGNGGGLVSVASMLQNMITPTDGTARAANDDDDDATSRFSGLSKLVGDIAKNLNAPTDGATVVLPSFNLSHPLGGLLSRNDKSAPAPAAAANTTVVAAANTSSPPPMPAAAVSPVPPPPAKLEGLQQECVNVRDVFASGDGYVAGVITSGTFPSGRICESTTFTYTVRYGPYDNCFTNKAINMASWTAPDTGAAGNASIGTDVKVEGCGAAVAAKAKSYAVWAKRSYSWAVTKKSDQSSVSVQAGKLAKATYTIDYIRTEVLVNPKISTTIQFDSLSAASPVSLSNFAFSITSSCPAGQKTKTGSFSCAASTIPAGGAPLTCQLQADLPCVGPGTIVATAMSGGSIVSSIPFNFPEPKAVDALAEAECAMVVDEFQSGDGFIAGNLTSGVRPYGKLCGSKSFTYTASFGPVNFCGKRKASNVASLTTGAPTKSASAQADMEVEVSGCDPYTPMNTAPIAAQPDQMSSFDVSDDAGMRLAMPELLPVPAASAQRIAAPGTGPTGCVSSVQFWRNCMATGTLAGRCAVVLKLPTGPQTPFFPTPANKIARNYNGVMSRSTDTGVRATDAWFRAAQAVASVQLNELAGVRLSGSVRDALSLVGAAVGSAVTAPPVLSPELQGVPEAVELLEKFSAGQAGTPAC